MQKKWLSHIKLGIFFLNGCRVLCPAFLKNGRHVWSLIYAKNPDM